MALSIWPMLWAKTVRPEAVVRIRSTKRAQDLTPGGYIGVFDFNLDRLSLLILIESVEPETAVVKGYVVNGAWHILLAPATNGLPVYLKVIEQGTTVMEVTHLRVVHLPKDYLPIGSEHDYQTVMDTVDLQARVNDVIEVTFKLSLRDKLRNWYEDKKFAAGSALDAWNKARRPKAKTPSPPRQSVSGFEDFDDDIPF